MTEKDQIHFSDKQEWKYELDRDYSVDTVFRILNGVNHSIKDYITLDEWGKLTIKKGYRWDGPSGPTIDSDQGMRGSLIHDALYQLIREGLLMPADKVAVDELFLRCLKEDGMGWWRRNKWHLGVKWFGEGAIKARNRVAPK